MLAVSPVSSCINDEREGREMESFSIGVDEFSYENNLLDDIDFDDIFFGIGEGDILPDLEMDSDMLAEFSISGGEETSEMNLSVTNSYQVEEFERREDDDRGDGSGTGSGSGSGLTSSHGEEIVSKRDESKKMSSSLKEGEKDRKSSRKSKGSHGKRKVKVDWTPELHRRFVQAVEQLGMDKAVPSRILELMGIDCLTRHNIASHLQKYRSHQKHLRAREAEAASWNQRRQILGGGGGVSKREITPWLAPPPPPPTMGFPPHNPSESYRPLHVWGHPTVDQSMMHMWPKHLAHSPSHARPPWAPPPPPAPSLTPPVAPPLLPNPSYWNTHHNVPHVLTQGTPCMPQPLAPTRFPTPPVPVPVQGIPHHVMYKVDQGIGVLNSQTQPYPPFDFHPSKESVDAALGDVLSKPWLPLPLGLKPPSLDSVMGELQRQGVSKIPPAHA